MAKKNKNKGVTAGDLFGKLGRTGPQEESGAQGQDEFDLADAIDVTSDADSDSDLDINALLKKYMPDDQDSEDEAPADGADQDAPKQTEKPARRKGGILSALKQSAKSDEDETADEKLMDALDSAFSLPSDEQKDVPEPEEAANDDSALSALARKMLGIAEEEAEAAESAKTEEPALPSLSSLMSRMEESLNDDPAETAEPEPAEPADTDEPEIPSFSSLMSRMEQSLNEQAEKAEPEPETAEAAPVSEPQPGQSAEDEDLLADVPALTDEDEDDEELINLFEDEKPRGLFATLFGKKKKKKEPEPEIPLETAEQPVQEEAPAEEPAPAEPVKEPVKAEPAEAASAVESVEEASDDFTSPDEAAAEEPSHGLLHGLFGDARLEQLMSIETEKSDEPAADDIPAAADASADETGLAEQAEQAEGEKKPVSEEDLEEMVRRMEDAGETFEESDDDFGSIDPTDISLMVAFGLDEGSGKTSGKAKEFGDKLQQRQETASKNKIKLDRAEFVDKTQTPGIRKEYKKRETSLWIRLALCAAFTIALFIFENIEFLTKLFTGSAKQFAGAFDPAVYPTVYVMASLQLMLLACVCAYDEILYGIRWLFRGTPRPQAVTALLTLTGIVYSAVTASLIVPPDEPVMFNFVTALAALLTLIAALYNVKRERMNFRVVANKRPKHIVRRLQDDESEGETKAFEDATDVCDVMKLEKTDFVEGFFARLEKQDPATGTFITCLLSIAVALAILFGLFVKFRGGNGVEIVRVFYAAMLMVTPLSVFISFSYPFYRANVEARVYDSAIIGESSLEEYSNASIISFDDKNVFPSYSVKVQNIRIYNNARIDRVLYYASSAFAYAGGPLQDVFEVATKDMGNSDNVKIFDTEAGFLATQVDGVNIIFGSYEALTARGLEIDPRAAEEDVDVSDELEIMYMFRESKLVAKMYVKYVMDADIDPILKQFSGSGLYVCVRTFDPNIDERMIAKKLNMKRMPLKIVRYASAEEVSRYEAKVDSGLVTCGTPKSLLQVISFCGKVLHSKKTNVALCVLSVLIGSSILLLLLLSNTFGSLTSFAIALYQAFWLITMAISSRAFIR